MKFTLTLTALIALALGFIAANQLIASLNITVNTEREFLVEQVSQSLKPQTKSTIALQNAIYQQRQQTLENKIKQTEIKTKSVSQYMAPLEQELIVYRETFAQKARANQDERLQLYIDIVSKYRDYHYAVTSLESFIPLDESDSLLSLPSVQLDLVYDAGGRLAQTHNQFISQERDSSFAAHYEPQLRRFLAAYELDVSLVECHASLCAVHMGKFWDDSYYQGYQEMWDQLSKQPWMDLDQVGSAHQYRGKGHQIQVWYLGARL